MAANPPPGYPRISPYLLYEDVAAMLEWLERAFAMTERQRMLGPEGEVVHAELTLEDGVVMIGSPGGDFTNPKHLGRVTSSLYVYVDDLDEHCERARRAGAEIIEELHMTEYGDRRYGAADPEGHHWYFASRP